MAFFRLTAVSFTAKSHAASKFLISEVLLSRLDFRIATPRHTQSKKCVFDTEMQRGIQSFEAIFILIRITFVTSSSVCQSLLHFQERDVTFHFHECKTIVAG